MIETLISSKTRVKLLLKFFLNGSATAYLRGLESELGESSNAIRLELNKFEKAGLLTTANQGNKKIFTANQQHPLFKDIHNILLKYVGIDQIMDNVISDLGNLWRVYLAGDFAKGLDAKIIDLVFIGELDREYLSSLCEKAEKLIDKRIRYITFSKDEFSRFFDDDKKQEMLLLWTQNHGAI